MGKVLKTFIILFIFTIALNAKILKKVTLQLSWFDQFQFAGYYIAKEKGYYEGLGLDVEIKPFAFGLDIPSDVVNQKSDFAIGRETLILDKSSGKDIVSLYALFQASPLILMSTKESGIFKIEDFKNKRIMTTIDDASEVSIKAMINSKKIKLEELNFLKHTHNIDDLINKNTDVISAYISKSPFILQKKGVKYNTFIPRDYGFDMYSDLLYTSKEFLDNDLNTVIAFKKASLKGWEYAYSNIEESVDLILKKYNVQNLTKEELLFEAKELKKLSYLDNKELGNINKEKLQRIFDLYNIMGLVKNKIDFNEFVYDKANELKLNNEELYYLSKIKKIKYCVIPKSLPYSDIVDGNLKGSVNDFINVIEKKVPTKFELVQTNTYVQSLDYLKNGKCDVIPSIGKTSSREKDINFTAKYLSIPAVIMTKNSKPFIENLVKLENVKIGITKGLAIYDTLKLKYPKIEFVQVDSLLNGLKMVRKDKLYGYITSLATAWHILQEEQLNNIKISGKIDEKIHLYMGVNKDQALLYEILKKAVLSLDKTILEKLVNSVSYIELKKSFNYKLLFQVLAFLMIIFAFTLYRQNLLKKLNNKLNEKVKEKTKELEEINATLEKRVKEQVEKNINKDKLLVRQSKMASMGEMLENIAHQWRQPLGVISVGASGLKIKKNIGDLDDKTLMDTLDSILDSTAYLSNTIDDFRFFFKPNKSKEIINLKSSIERSINLISSKFYNQKIKFVKNIDDLEINTYESELMQVIINILNNSKDALLSNKELSKYYIFINVTKSSNKTLIKIRDNAGGVDSTIIDKIFEPYFTTKHKSQGTGIGLYMCQEIIHKYMNGNITVSNKSFEYKKQRFEGAEFTIELYDENE